MQAKMVDGRRRAGTHAVPTERIEQTKLET